MNARAPPGSSRIPSGAFPSARRFTCFLESGIENDQLSASKIADKDIFAIVSEL